jgi:hypothetical protein
MSVEYYEENDVTMAVLHFPDHLLCHRSIEVNVTDMKHDAQQMNRNMERLQRNICVLLDQAYSQGCDRVRSEMKRVLGL